MKKKTQTKILSGPGIEATIKAIKEIDKTITAVQEAGVNYTTIANSSQVTEEQAGLSSEVVKRLAMLAETYYECKQEMAFYGNSERFQKLTKKSQQRRKDVDDALLDLWNVSGD